MRKYGRRTFLIAAFELLRLLLKLPSKDGSFLCVVNFDEKFEYNKIRMVLNAKKSYSKMEMNKREEVQ